MYAEVVSSCSIAGLGSVSMRTDCFERVYTAPTELQLQTEACAGRNATDDGGRIFWNCFLPEHSTNPVRPCCAALRAYESEAVMGSVNICEPPFHLQARVVCRLTWSWRCAHGFACPPAQTTSTGAVRLPGGPTRAGRVSGELP